MNLDERGSMTVEAAVVFPFFLVVLLLLVTMIHIAMVQITMDHAVDETAKKIAAYSFPLRDMSGKAADILNIGADSPEQVNTVGVFFPGAGTFLEAVREYLRSGAEGVLEQAIKNLAEEELKSHIPLADNTFGMPFQITDFKIYNPFKNKDKEDQESGQGGEKDIVIKISYTVKISIPFCPLKEVHLKSSATERAWVD